MSEATERLIDTAKDLENPAPSDASIPGPGSLPSVKSETNRARPWHRKYLCRSPLLVRLLGVRLYTLLLKISFFYTLFAAMLSASVGYMSYVMSDGNEWARYGIWTLLLFNGNHTIFRLIRPKKSKGPSDLSNRVQVYHAKITTLWSYIFISDILAQVLTNMGLGFFHLDQIPSTHDICANQVDSLGHRRCHLWKGARILQLAVPCLGRSFPAASFSYLIFCSVFVASAVLRRAATERFGKEKVPMGPPPQVEAWQMATLEQLNEDTEPTQV